MKSIFATTILGIGSLCAQELVENDKTELLSKPDEDFVYTKLSDQWGICPGLGFVYRQHKMHGFDIDLTAYSYWDAGFSLYGKTHYLFYPIQKYFYLGIGAGVIGGSISLFKGDHGAFVNPTLEGVIGVEWNNGTPIFLQLEVGGSYGFVPIFPSLSLGIGF